LTTWTIAHPARLVAAVGKGEVTATDAFYYLDEIRKIGAMPYRKLLDLTGLRFGGLFLLMLSGLARPG
jgi:hypothetical protein